MECELANRTGEGGRGFMYRGTGVGRGLYSEIQVEQVMRVLYGEVQCIKWGSPLVNRQTRLKTLPSRNFVVGW